MTKLVVCLLFFGLLTIQTVGQMNSDPAPGRSPGPPNNLHVAYTNHNIRDIYKSNSISNKLKRHNAAETAEISRTHNRKLQITTPLTQAAAMTATTETTNTAKITNNVIKPLSITNDVVYDVDGEANVEIPTTISQIKKSSSYKEVYHTATKTTTTANNVTKSDTKASILSSDALIACSDSSFSEFLNDVLVIEDLDNPQAQATDESHQQPQPHLNIDLSLEHDIFDTTTALGITCGLMYKVRLLSSLTGPFSKYLPHYSGEFLVETVSSSSGREHGSFVGHTLGNKLPISWFNNLQRYAKDASGNVQATTARVANNNSNEQHYSRMTANSKTARGNNASTTSRTPCPANKWRDSVKSHASGLRNNESTESLNLWLVNELCERDDIIELRVFFRAIFELNRGNYSRDNVANTEAQHVVFKKTFKYQLHKDCQLILREMSAGTLDYTALPLYTHDCLVYFPSYQNYQASSSNTNTPPPGILVNMERLNVPCNTGGYVRFSERGLKLCGKLEELPPEQRTYHFDVRIRAAVNFYKNPMFSLSYKLVDFCYNITASNETGDFYIQSRRRDSLECYFRLHLPYGNRILLRLVANNVSAIMSSTDVQSSWKELHTGDLFPSVGAEDDSVYTMTGDSIDTQVINLTLSSLSSSNTFAWSAATPMLLGTNQAINAQILGTASCRGLIIKVFEHDHAKWSHCVNSTQYMSAFLIESTSNTLSVHLYRAASEITNTRLPGRLNSVYGAHISHGDIKQHALPTIYLSYQARPMSELAANCEFGWIAMQQFCITAIEKAVVWHEGEKYCANLGGNLASVRNEAQQKIVNDMLLHSPGYTDEAAYWVGGSDLSYEGDFRWNDGLQFQYTNWFPGWEQHGHYNKQPNDDGLSSQDCIELRRYFRSPPGVQTNRTPLTDSYMWNDRDCNTKNFMICEKPMSDESLLRNWINDCNKTVSLTKEHPRASIWSPSFPRQYPDNANCYTTITAPAGYRIVIEFEELVIENEPGCTYDYLEISEPVNLETTTRTPKSNKQNILNENNKSSSINTVHKRNSNVDSNDYVSSTGANSDTANEYSKSYLNYDRTSVINKNTDASDHLNVYTSSYTNFNNLAQNNYQRLLHIFSSLYKLHTNFIIQTPDYPKGNPYFQHAARGAISSAELIPKRLCGDWSSKLKLLRYVSTSSYLGLHFISDYSHHFGGYKAKTYMENRSHLLRAASECANERLKPYNGSCYLFVSYPEVDWWTAQQVCRAMGAKLSSVSSADEHRFITSNIRNQIDYSPQLIYWLGAELEKNGQFEWTDDTKMSFQGWLPGQGQFDELPVDATCLGLQWKMSPTPMLPSGLYWQSQKCNKVGGYVCKKPKESFGNFSFNNFTVSGTEGRLVSPAYPNSYPLNIDYWIHIKSPERTRIIVQFQKIDLEAQDECLYDFVSIQDYDSTIRLEPGTNTMPVAMYSSEKWDAMLNESADSDYYAAAEYKRGNRLMKRLQRLQSHKRRRRRRRRRRRNINATEMKNIELDHKSNTAIFVQKTKTQQQQATLQQPTSIDRNTQGVAVVDRQHNDNKNNLDKIFVKHIANIAVKTNENPKRRRRKRCITEIENKWPNNNNNKNNVRERRSTVLGDNSRSTADNAQTYLPYVRWCGAHDANMSKFDFVSRANEVMLNFHSDYSINGLGFAAIWKAIDISACPLQTLTSREGVIVSPNYPHFVLNNLNCAYVIQAPLGRRVWLEFIEFDLHVDALMELDLGNGVFRPFHNRQHINEGIFVSVKEHLRIHLRTGQHPRGKGFQAVYQTLGPLDQRERVINLTSNATGHLYQLNYPHDMPVNVDFIQHLVAPFGDNILLELHGVEFSEQTCIDNNLLEIYDNYADNNGTKWQLCKFPNVNLPAENSDYDDGNDAKIDRNADASDIIADDNAHISGRSMEHIAHQHMRHASSQYFSGQALEIRLSLAPPVFITSYLNTLHIRQRSTSKEGINLNATVRVQWDNNYKFKLATSDKAVESCQPNPCQHNGKCVLNNGSSYCQCQGYYTGRFCGLTLCELEPCVFGKCELTSNNFKCQCQPGYMGTTCEQKQRPCAENPCEGRGICFERNGGFYCRCHAWWEGHKCERRMLHIPYKPLSERMLQEPFWLGLITVFVVMAVIGLVWCAKRHFPEKIEKLLAEEADRNRPPGTAHGHHHHTSLREQLQFTSAIPQPTAVSNAAGAQRSIFNRLGIRKPSLLSLSSPNPTPCGGGTAARTFSLDDLLRPPPRRSPSPRKKRNNSTPVKKNAAEKNEILQQLVSPAATTATKSKVSLGELIIMSENRLRTHVDSESDIKETTFSENSGSTGSAQITRNATDPKLEKKVTFARLLNKVSAEMSSGSEMDIGPLANSSALSLPTDIQYRACSMPPSPCTNDLRSPHSTSSNQCSESLSSSDLALTDFGLRSMQNSSNDMGGSNNTSMIGLPLGNLATRYRIGMTSSTATRPKVSSADSILAMFRHMAIASAATTTQATAKIVTANTASSNAHASNITGTINNLPPPLITTSVLISPSTTPTISSPQDDAPGDDESSTSSMYTPVSCSSGATDSPVMYRHKATIEVPVLDVINAHKTNSPVLSSSATTGANSNSILHPPTILLEIPNNGMNNKCLSPIRELPTPMPSPALTPVMPRPQRVQSPIFQDEPLFAGDYTDDEEDDRKSDDQSHPLTDIRLELPQDTCAKQNCMLGDAKSANPKTSVTINLNSQQTNMRKLPLLRLSPATPTMNSPKNSPAFPTVPIITIDVVPATPEEKVQRPRDLIIPTLTVQQPSPTKHRHPLIIYPGSPPPQRASIGETSFMFPNNQQQKRLLKEFEKPTSLDFACEPPMITITANMSELESDDTDPLSPACKTSGAAGLMPPNPAGMCYLSPFTMCSRADRTISESNLSSSGYSSMASPGPSRCGSSNPLCPNEMDEQGSAHNVGVTLPLHMNLMNRRKNASLASCKENIHNGQTAVALKNTHQQRQRSDSETLSDDILLESNDEGISTDHVDEKLEDTRLVDLRSKELNIFCEEHILIEVDEPPAPTNSSGSSSSSSSTAALISYTQQTPQLTTASTAATIQLQQAPQQQTQQMSQLQLPSIVIQIDGNDKGFSSVSSRSESPLSERAGVGRFSPHFYGRKDLLPFTDSDGLYDFPSSDGKGASAPLYTHQRRSSSKKRDRKSSKCSTMQSPTKQQQLHEATAKENLNTTSSPSSCSIAHACNKHCHSHHHSCTVSTVNVPRKSPKRRIIRPPVASSSSSSESIASTKEIVMRSLPRRFNSPNREKRSRQQESLSEDEVADALLRRISPSIVKEEHSTKPKCKINRLRAIGNQIRFLRRLEKSIKTRERIVSPSDSCPEENTDEPDSPLATSPLLLPTSPTKMRLPFCRQKRLPSSTYGITTAALKPNQWQNAERNLISDELNSD